MTLNIDSANLPIPSTGGDIDPDAFSVSSFSIGDIDISQAVVSNFALGTNIARPNSVFFSLTTAAAGPLGMASVDIVFEDISPTLMGTTFHLDDIDVENYVPFLPIADSITAGNFTTGVFMFLAVGGTQGFIQAEIDSFERVVPVPGAIWLLLSALGILGLRKKY